MPLLEPTKADLVFLISLLVGEREREKSKKESLNYTVSFFLSH